MYALEWRYSCDRLIDLLFNLWQVTELTPCETENPMGGSNHCFAEELQFLFILFLLISIYFCCLCLKLPSAISAISDNKRQKCWQIWTKHSPSAPFCCSCTLYFKRHLFCRYCSQSPLSLFNTEIRIVVTTLKRGEGIEMWNCKYPLIHDCSSNQAMKNGGQYNQCDLHRMHRAQN